MDLTRRKMGAVLPDQYHDGLHPQVSERPRVLLLTPHFPPTQGGIADYARWLVEELATLGFEMRVLTSLCPDSPASAAFSVSATVEHLDGRLCRAVADEVASFKPDILHIEYQQTMYGGYPAIGLLPLALPAPGARPPIR